MDTSKEETKSISIEKANNTQLLTKREWNMLKMNRN